jgi:hypothetical protein
LSFLDHHLRCGNSLIGAELDKLMILPNSKRDPGQLPMWQFVLRQQKEHTEDLLKRYAEMAARPDDDLKTVKEKEKKYEELREEELSRRLTDLADIWLSTFFGNEVDEEEYQELQNYLSPQEVPGLVRVQDKRIVCSGQDVSFRKEVLPLGAGVPGGVCG